MRRTILTITALYWGLLLMASQAGAVDPWPDEVISVTYGVGAGFGQESFPDNILGPPDPVATPSVPSSSPVELLTLGTSGVIILAFRDGGIVDGAGPDFTVFENPFYYGMDSLVYRETAIVAVSEDGVTWYEFPYDPDTFAGLAGVTPVDGSADPLDPTFSGGDAFDLADVGLAHAAYVRITDSGDFVPDSGPSFDLDAVAVLHGESGNGINDSENSLPDALTITAWPNPFNSVVRFKWSGGVYGNTPVRVFDTLGREIYHEAAFGVNTWVWQPASTTSAGVYWVQVGNGIQTQMTRVVLVR